jgi:hypothetical protein
MKHDLVIGAGRLARGIAQLADSLAHLPEIVAFFEPTISDEYRGVFDKFKADADNLKELALCAAQLADGLALDLDARFEAIAVLLAALRRRGLIR